MAELLPEDLVELPAEIQVRIEFYEGKIVAIEAQLRENAAAIDVTVDRERKSALKRRGSELAEALSDARAIIARLHAAKSQSVANQKLRERGGIPFESSLWPTRHFDSDDRRRRARSRGIE